MARLPEASEGGVWRIPLDLTSSMIQSNPNNKAEVPHLVRVPKSLAPRYTVPLTVPISCRLRYDLPAGVGKTS